jgi:hypothetical protein
MVGEKSPYRSLTPKKAKEKRNACDIWPGLANCPALQSCFVRNALKVRSRLQASETPRMLAEKCKIMGLNIFLDDSDHDPCFLDRIVHCVCATTQAPPTEAPKLFKCEFFYLNFSI